MHVIFSLCIYTSLKRSEIPYTSIETICSLPKLLVHKINISTQNHVGEQDNYNGGKLKCSRPSIVSIPYATSFN
jgi:hypothetical protein